jgi:hypothetical protein
MQEGTMKMRVNYNLILAIIMLLGSIAVLTAGCNTSQKIPSTASPVTSPTLSQPVSIEAKVPPEPTIPTDATIPASYTTYTSEANLFSISYPSDWETSLSSLSEIEKSTKKLLSDLSSDIPIEKASMIFLAIRRTGTGYDASVNILVEPALNGISTSEQAAELEMRGVKQICSDMHIFSSVETTIGGRKATIEDYEATIPGKGKYHVLSTVTLVDRTIWVVTCGLTNPEDFSKWKNDFLSIVKSLRITK